MGSKVYFIQASVGEGEQAISEKARSLFRAGGFKTCFQRNDFTAVKVHVGEDKNTTYIKAPCLKGLVEELIGLKTKPFITDTSTLYTGRRHNAIDHTVLAAERGFGVEGLGVPFIAPDGLFGTAETAVRIDGELDREVSIAADIVRCQSILSVAHFTGHCAACAGATLKTLGMGCASRKGKMRQHAALKPQVKTGQVCPLRGMSPALPRRRDFARRGPVAYRQGQMYRLCRMRGGVPVRRGRVRLDAGEFGPAKEHRRARSRGSQGQGGPCGFLQFSAVDHQGL